MEAATRHAAEEMLMRDLARCAAAGVAVMVAGGHAAGQSLNIDFGDQFGVPPSTFAGAGLAGVWNALPGQPGPHALVGLGGAPVAAAVELVFPYYGSFENPDPVTNGPVEALLDDAVGDGDDLLGIVLFDGLEPGDYTVYTHAYVSIDPSPPTPNTAWVWVGDESPAGAPFVLTGHLTGSELVEGVTYAVHHVKVADGRIRINLVSGFWVFSTWFLNGIQLVRDQGCYADCNADGGLTVADFGCFQTRFVGGDPYADCNGDGARTVADFGCFQTKFVTGCP